MNLKTLPFNKTLLKKDWKLTKWLYIIVASILFFTMTLGVINSYSNYQQLLKDIEEHPEWDENFHEEVYKSSVRDSLEFGFKHLTGAEPVIIVLMPMTVAALLFGEEKRRKTFEVLSTMPFTRWEIFFNKVIIAFVNILLPFIVNALIMIIALGFSKGLREFYTAGLVMHWFGANAFRLFVILSFSLLFASLTGTTVSQMVLTGIFFIFPIGFAGLIRMNMFVWGYNAFVIDVFLDKFGKYIVPAVMDDIESIPVIYHILMGIVMLIASKLLFDRNRLERSGETLEFESIETFFKLGVTVCTSLLVGILFPWFGRGIMLPEKVLVIVGYIAGIFIGWYTANYSIKSNRIKA